MVRAAVVAAPPHQRARGHRYDSTSKRMEVHRFFGPLPRTKSQPLRYRQSGYGPPPASTTPRMSASGEPSPETERHQPMEFATGEHESEGPPPVIVVARDPNAAASLEPQKTGDKGSHPAPGHRKKDRTAMVRREGSSPEAQAQAHAERRRARGHCCGQGCSCSGGSSQASDAAAAGFRGVAAATAAAAAAATTLCSRSSSHRSSRRRRRHHRTRHRP